MVKLTENQNAVMVTEGHQLVTGGPGSGKTTVSILKAAKIARESLLNEQRILFLSFARATVSRVWEAIDEEQQISDYEKKHIEVDTYHAFFWRILKTHGYLIGFPRKMTLLTPSDEAIALSEIRSKFGKNSNLSNAQKTEKKTQEDNERLRLAYEEGCICFDLFADSAAKILNGSEKVRNLISTMYPFIILDEFQDTSLDQWRVVKALGKNSTLIALADPEQRIFDFIGADPQRINHFQTEFNPSEFDLAGNNHRSKGTDIALFGDDILGGNFQKSDYKGVEFELFESNHNQAYATLVTQVLQARKRLIDKGIQGWSLAILVPTKKMTRLVSDELRKPFGKVPEISHTAAVDMEGPILAAEVIAYLLQPQQNIDSFDKFVGLLCNYFLGRGGSTPTKGSIDEANRFTNALKKWNECQQAGKKVPEKSVLRATNEIYETVREVVFTGNPDNDWLAVREILDGGGCNRLKNVAQDVRDVRLLDRGTQLRQGLTQNWRDNGCYCNSLAIIRQAFVQEHFATANKSETGIVVMNMHKAKGKQFDEVIIFEGWPHRVKGKIVANPNRIIRGNVLGDAIAQARQNFRVSITRAKIQTTILTPKDDICVLFKSSE